MLLDHVAADASPDTLWHSTAATSLGSERRAAPLASAPKFAKVSSCVTEQQHQIERRPKENLAAPSTPFVRSLRKRNQAAVAVRPRTLIVLPVLSNEEGGTWSRAPPPPRVTNGQKHSISFPEFDVIGRAFVLRFRMKRNDCRIGWLTPSSAENNKSKETDLKRFGKLIRSVDFFSLLLSGFYAIISLDTRRGTAAAGGRAEVKTNSRDESTFSLFSRCAPDRSPRAYPAVVCSSLLIPTEYNNNKTR